MRIVETKLSLGNATAPLKDPKAFRVLLQSLHRKNWVVYVKQAMAGPKPVLRYLGRYTAITGSFPSMGNKSLPAGRTMHAETSSA